MFIEQLTEQDPTRLISFVNPESTNHRAPGHQEAIQWLFPLAQGSGPITEVAHPLHLRKHASADGVTVVTAEGGDHTMNSVIAACMGYAPQERSFFVRAAQKAHKDPLEDILFVPIGTGNANNLARSALGPYASDPRSLLVAPDLSVRQFYPLLYSVLTSGGQQLQNGIVTSCIGLQTAALAAGRLDARKAALRKLEQSGNLKDFRRLQRLGREGLISFRAAWDAKPFSATLTTYDAEGSSLEARSRTPLVNQAAFELIGSSIYAKVGRTSVNIDDTYQQPVTIPHRANRLRRLGTVGTALGRVVLGQHKADPLDCANLNMSMQITGQEPVAFHVDGDILPDLQPGHILVIQQSRRAIHVLMRSSTETSMPQSRRQVSSQIIRPSKLTA